MIRKTLLHVAPGTELDWDNENHRRILEAQAYAGIDEHPKPTMAPPERSRWWWFWRAFGFFIYRPARKHLMSFLKRDWVNSVNGEFARPGYWVYKWPLARLVTEWIERGPTKYRAFWLRVLLAWLTDINVYSQCSWCGFTEYCDEFTVHEHPDDDGREISMFEHVEGGDVDYWGEGQDAYGWKWCYRCGAVDWDVA